MKFGRMHPCIAFAIGGVVSAAFLVIDRVTDSATFLTGWMLPGMIAAYPFFGAFDDAIFGETVIWAVNSVVYGLPMFVVLYVGRMLSHRRAQLDIE